MDARGGGSPPIPPPSPMCDYGRGGLFLRERGCSALFYVFMCVVRACISLIRPARTKNLRKLSLGFPVKGHGFIHTLAHRTRISHFFSLTVCIVEVEEVEFLAMRDVFIRAEDGLDFPRPSYRPGTDLFFSLPG